MRGIAIHEASTVGSVPALADPPHDEELEEDGLQAVLMDKLGERLAFERSGARLYEAFVAKCERLDDADPALLDTLNHIRDEELHAFRDARFDHRVHGPEPLEEALAEEEEHLQALRELLASAVQAQAQAMRTESIRTAGTKE